jgi:hypothetical protein
LPDTLEVLDAGVFQQVATLTRATLTPNSKLTRLGARAFAETKITTISLPGCFRQADIEVFQNCKSLRDVNIPGDSIFEYIPPRAFQGAENLIKVDLPGALHLSEAVFDGCTKLKSVKFISVTIPPGASEELIQQIKERRKRRLVLPRAGTANIFGNSEPYVLYPEGTLKDARKALRNEIDFF